MTGPISFAPIITPETLYKIDLILEDIYPESVTAGAKLNEVGLKNAQIRGLENIVTSSSRFSEILNFIKNQVGKERDTQWSAVAPVLLRQLEELEKQAHHLSEGNAAACLEIKMKLARGWAKQVVTHFLYATSQRKQRKQI